METPGCLPGPSTHSQLTQGQYGSDRTQHTAAPIQGFQWGTREGPLCDECKLTSASAFSARSSGVLASGCIVWVGSSMGCGRRHNLAGTQDLESHPGRGSLLTMCRGSGRAGEALPPTTSTRGTWLPRQLSGVVKFPKGHFANRDEA